MNQQQRRHSSISVALIVLQAPRPLTLDEVMDLWADSMATWPIPPPLFDAAESLDDSFLDARSSTSAKSQSSGCSSGIATIGRVTIPVKFAQRASAPAQDPERQSSVFISRRSIALDSLKTAFSPLKTAEPAPQPQGPPAPRQGRVRGMVQMFERLSVS